jgi:hypothetical protein
MTVRTATPRTAPPTLRNIHVVDAGDSPLVYFLCGCDNRHVVDKVYRSNAGNVQDHAGDTELPILVAVAHASEQYYTSQNHQPASYEQVAGANGSQEKG